MTVSVAGGANEPVTVLDAIRGRPRGHLNPVHRTRSPEITAGSSRVPSMALPLLLLMTAARAGSVPNHKPSSIDRV